MSIASRITAITGHITDIYDTLELGGDTTQNKNIVNINTEIKREYKNFLANGTDTLWNNWEKVSGSGETLTLNNTMEGKMKVDLKGNTYQYSTSGKNKYNATKSSDTTYNITNSATTSTISINGTANASNRIAFGSTTLTAGTYTFSMERINANRKIEFYVYKTGTWENPMTGHIEISNTQDKDSKSFTLSEDMSIMVGIWVNNGDQYSNCEVKYQIVSGSSADYNFEPYTNGASPSPDYPQDIQVVSGDNTLKVYGGENLFTTIMEQNAWTFENGGSYTSPNYIRTQDKISVEAGRTYRLMFDGVQPSDNNSGFVFYNNGTFVSGLQTTNLEVTIPNGANQMVYDLYRAGGIVPSDISNIRLYRIDQTYPISLGNIELCKIGTYQDKIVKDNGKWYLNKQIGKVVLDGSENWYVRTGTKYNCQMTNNLPSNKGTGANFTGYSNYYIAGGNWDYSEDKTILVYKNSAWNYANIQITDSSFATAQELRNWLNTHNTELYYPLATPTYEEITDSGLKEQLNNLENAMSYDSQTNISQTNDDLPFVLNVVALKEIS